MYCKYVSNVNAIYTQSLQINHSLLSTTHHPSRISHDQTASIMLPLFPWKVSINVSNNQSICPTVNNETIDFVASGRTSACITSELMSLLIKVNPQGTSLFWTQNAAIIQMLCYLCVFYLFCFLSRCRLFGLLLVSQSIYFTFFFSWLIDSCLFYDLDLLSSRLHLSQSDIFFYIFKLLLREGFK